jgi:hypothetical protein
MIFSVVNCHVRSSSLFLLHKYIGFKGTVARDFPPPFFPSKVPTLDLDSYRKFFFKFGFKFVELLQLKFDSPLQSNLSAALCSGESNLADACCSGESNLPTAFCSGEMWLPAAPCIRSYCCKMQRGAKSYSCMIQRRVNLTAPWCSGKSNLTAAWCSGKSIWQRGVKSQNFGRLPRPLKGQSCKKSHMGDLHYPIPMRIMC